MLRSIAFALILFIKFFTCEALDNDNYFRRAFKWIRPDNKKDITTNNELSNRCNIWEALHRYDRKDVDISDLIEQSKTLLEQISKKAISQDTSFDNYKLKIIDELSNLVLKQIAILELVDNEKEILINAADVINNIILKLISKYNISIKEPNVYDMNTNEIDNQYSVISDKDNKISIISEDLGSSVEESDTEDGTRNENKRVLKNSKTKIPKDSNDNVSKFTKLRRIFKKSPSLDSKADGNENIIGLYELIESLVYGSGKLKLLVNGLDWVKDNASGVYSRASWNLNEELKKIS